MRRLFEARIRGASASLLCCSSSRSVSSIELRRSLKSVIKQQQKSEQTTTITTTSASQQMAGTGSSPHSVRIEPLLNKLQSDFPSEPEATLLQSVIKNREAFSLVGSNVSLSSNVQHAMYPRIRRALSALDDKGGPASQFAQSLGFSHIKEKEFEELCELFELFFEVKDDDTVVPIRHDTNLFVRALRRVIDGAPDEGFEVSDIQRELEKILGEGKKSSPSAHGFPQLAHALAVINDAHYISGQRVIPVTWDSVMERVALRMPPEGVLQPALCRLISAECPGFKPSTSLGSGVLLREWVDVRFGHYIDVSISKDDDVTPIYRPKCKNAVSSAPSFEVDLWASLELISSGGNTGSTTARQQGDEGKASNSNSNRHRNGSSVIGEIDWVDFDYAKRFMGSPAQYGMKTTETWLPLLNMSENIEQDIRLAVRAARFSNWVLLLVDTTGLEASTVNETIAALDLVPAQVAQSKIFRTTGTSTAFASDDVLVPDWMEVDHAICAHLSALADDARSPVSETKDRTKIYVICAKERKALYEGAEPFLNAMSGFKETEVIAA